MEHREIFAIYKVVARCKSNRCDCPLLLYHRQQNHRYSRLFNGQLYDAIIMYRFRSRLLVFSMYRGYRSRVNRTGNEFSVQEKRRKQSIGRAQMVQPDEPSLGHAHYVCVSHSILLTLSLVVRTHESLPCLFCLLSKIPSKLFFVLKASFIYLFLYV